MNTVTEIEAEEEISGKKLPCVYLKGSHLLSSMFQTPSVEVWYSKSQDIKYQLSPRG